MYKNIYKITEYLISFLVILLHLSPNDYLDLIFNLVDSIVDYQSNLDGLLLNSYHYHPPLHWFILMLPMVRYLNLCLHYLILVLLKQVLLIFIDHKKIH